MLRFLNQCSQGRGAWLLMAFTALALELTALWFQHVMLLKPCVLCIYERCALFGVLGAALIGAIAPKTPLRYVAMVIWFSSKLASLNNFLFSPTDDTSRIYSFASLDSRMLSPISK